MSSGRLLAPCCLLCSLCRLPAGHAAFSWCAAGGGQASAAAGAGPGCSSGAEVAVAAAAP